MKSSFLKFSTVVKLLSNLQALLQRRAGLFLPTIKGVGVDVQCGGDLRVTQKLRHGGHICSTGNQQTGIGVAQGVDGEILR